MYPTGCFSAFEALMKETPNQNHYDSGHDGVLAECRSCRFHRPYWQFQSCVYKECPYSPYSVSTAKKATADCHPVSA